MLARIYRPAKTAMQSGKAAAKRWRLEFASNTAPRTEALMGWLSSAEPSGQVKLSFETKDEAIAFARAHNIPHQVAEREDGVSRQVEVSDRQVFPQVSDGRGPRNEQDVGRSAKQPRKRNLHRRRAEAGCDIG